MHAESLKQAFRRENRLHTTVLLAGLVTLGLCISLVGETTFKLSDTLLLIGMVPLIVVMARFPVTLESSGNASGVEIGFDSSILMFLLSTVDARQAILAWAAGTIITQVIAGKRLFAVAFNIGVGILAGAVAASVFVSVRGAEQMTPRELVAIAVAATSYFLIDYLLSAVAVAWTDGIPVVSSLAQRGALLAVGCFVAFDLLGYLAAVVHRVAPWWLVPLLAVPLGTLLIATRAVTRARENARRLQVLLDAASRAQTLYELPQVSHALTENATALLKLSDVTVRPEPPGENELGARVLRGKEELWVVAPNDTRSREIDEADKQALEALAAIASDAYSRIQLTEDMVHYARHDPLTDLPNRGILQDRVARAIATAKRHGSGMSLLLLDLDGFKPVNDRFGHLAGDRVLRHVAKSLLSCVRATDTVSRLGGDEFAVLLEEIDPTQTQMLSDRILRSFEGGVEVSGRMVPLSASIGVRHAEPGATTESLLREADLAMYEAKRRGKNLVVEFDPTMGATRLRKLEMVERLRRAVAHDEIAVVYQPVVNAESGFIAGVEALARWRVDGEAVPPDVFIPLAEETGLVVALGERVLMKAAHDAARLREVAGTRLSMSVNVSAQQLREPEFTDVVRQALDVIGEGLVLEITEREGIGDDPVALAAMHEISALGVRFAIDDFGVGFSSIGYLQDVPAHIIKADRALSRNIDRDERARVLLRSIASLGHHLGMDVVVEGIERESQLAMVRDDMHARFAQGYYMHLPMGMDEIVGVLDGEREDHLAAVPADGETIEPADTRIEGLPLDLASFEVTVKVAETAAAALEASGDLGPRAAS